MNFFKKLLASVVIFCLTAVPSFAVINTWKVLGGTKLAPWNASVTDVCFDYAGAACLSSSGTTITTPGNFTVDGLLTAAGIDIGGTVNSGDINLYDAVNDGNPALNIGSTSANQGTIQAFFDTGTQTLDYFNFATTSATEGDIVFQPAGFVGIGTTTPAKLLHMVGDGTLESGYARFGLSTTEYTEIGHQGSNGSINTVGDGQLDFRHDGADKMRLSDAGVLTLTGDLGLTATRIVKGWFTDLEVTNAIVGSITGSAATVTNATFTTALTVDTGTVGLTGNVANSSVLTLGAGASSISGANTGDNAGVTAVTGTSPVVSSGGATPAISIPAATNAVAGHATAAHILAIEANTTKNTNVPTALSAGTINATTYGITSDGGVDDIVLPEATTTLAGILGAAKWNEIVANTLKVTESTTVTAPLVKTTYDISIPVAATAADGYLAQADWNTFNGKQGILTNSAGLLGALDDETGTGLAVFATTPTFTTPNIGSATGSLDAGGGALEIPNGTDLPASCSIGQIFQDTNDDTCADENVGDGALCICKSLNTWALISNF